MLPVERGAGSVGRQIVAYSWVMVATSLAARPGGPMGWVYTVTAVARRARCSSPRRTACTGPPGAGSTGAALKPMRLFHYSITYVTVLFLAVAVDPLVFVALG